MTLSPCPFQCEETFGTVEEQKERWASFCDVMSGFVDNIEMLRRNLRNAGLESCKANVLNKLKAFLQDNSTATSISHESEQLQLHAAALPKDHPERDHLLAAAETTSAFMEAGKSGMLQHVASFRVV